MAQKLTKYDALKKLQGKLLHARDELSLAVKEKSSYEEGYWTGVKYSIKDFINMIEEM